jgi:hypothetical protein
MQFQVFDSLLVCRVDQTDNLVLDDQHLVSYLLDKFPRLLESGSCVSVPMEDLGQQRCLSVAGAFYNLAPGLWARASPDRVLLLFAVVKEHGCLLFVHASMRKNIPAHICCACACSRPQCPRAVHVVGELLAQPPQRVSLSALTRAWACDSSSGCS